MPGKRLRRDCAIESGALMADKMPAKKSPYRKDTGIPDLLLPRCAHGITSDLRDGKGFPIG
jgi:hypothetical protein